MALQRMPGFGAWFPMRMVQPASGLLVYASVTIDATGERSAVCGRVWFAERTGSKTITGVGFRTGSIVSAGGSGLTISLQNVSTAAGPPMRPDDVQDQTVGVALSALTASAWNTVTFSSSRTVNYGDVLSVVWEYDGSGRLGADAFNVAHISTAASRPMDAANVQLRASGAWSTSSLSLIPNIILIFDDGTFGTFTGAFPCSAIGSLVIDTGTTPDEVAVQFSLPVPCKVDSFEALMEFASGSWSAILYEGTTALQTFTPNTRHHAMTLGDGRFTGPMPLPAEQELAADTVYRLALRPNSASSISVQYFDVAAAGHLVCHGGTAMHYWDRTNAGAWSNETLTRSLIFRLGISALDDGVQVGGDTIFIFSE
jgi:hypothetical protein